MSTNNICSFIKLMKIYRLYLNTKKLLDCALIGLCAVIRLNMIFILECCL